MKSEDYENYHFSGVPGSNVLGAVPPLSYTCTAQGNAKIFNNQQGLTPAHENGPRPRFWKPVCRLPLAGT